MSKIVADDKIPFIDGLFDSHATLVRLGGGDISNSDIKDADALIVRTRTRCDKKLLEGSSVKYIATATIGYDHIDMEYCKSKGIEVSTAAGCNANGVLQYVMAALAEIEKEKGVDIRTQKLAIIGVGNIGSRVREMARLIGIETICCDPFKGDSSFVSLTEAVSQCDIVTVHVPLTKDGSHPTYNMLSDNIFDMMHPGCYFINSSRAEVVSEAALLKNSVSGKIKSILDVWHNEPNINRELANAAFIATTHIAGYSVQGKANASAMSVRAIARALSITPLKDWSPEGIELPPSAKNISWTEVKSCMTHYFDIMAESRALKSRIVDFEQIRSKYKFRNEFFAL